MSKPISREAGKSAKPCECLDRIRKQLTDKYGPVDLELKWQVNIQTGAMTSALPPLNFTYTEGKKKKRSFIWFSRCPFCGQPYPQ